ncbi:hypothetical protein ACSBR1_037653 [Camellia fascicularis]
MGHELRYLCPVEARRLVWLIGMMFAVVLIVQHFEFPYNSVLVSIYSFRKPQVLGNGTFSTGNSSANPKIFGNMKSFNGSNSTETDTSHSVVNMTKNDSIELSHNSTVDIAITDNSSFGIVTPATPSIALSPIISLPNLDTQTNVDTNSQSPMMSVYPNTSSVEKDIGNTLPKDEKSGELQIDNSSSKTIVPAVNEMSERPTTTVVSISEMNDLLLQSRASSLSMKPRWSSAVDQDLLNAKLQIENEPVIENDTALYAPLYRNVSMFKKSYELMEQMLKVYIYKEGERPIFHEPVLKGVYGAEGWFMKQLQASKQFVTTNPTKAHLFYLPFSSRMLEVTLYEPNSDSYENLVQYLKNYLNVIVARYNFWNRTDGADHFLVACHDWAPYETKQHMAHCIRALCNSNIKEGFKFGKDVSLPASNVRSSQNPLKELGGHPPPQRQILAFFAGRMHGYLRPILLQYWNKDPDMKIVGRMRRVKGQMNYVQYMKSSKYCICPKGYEVSSPRVVESIFYECVPVIISDNFVPPLFEILNWESFAVFVPEKEIPNLKNILLSIPEKRYLEMHQSVKKVQQHFLWHTRPVKYDIFHMILHSIWHNRVFRIRPR